MMKWFDKLVAADMMAKSHERVAMRARTASKTNKH